jgi:hypothetical protein
MITVDLLIIEDIEAEIGRRQQVAQLEKPIKDTAKRGRGLLVHNSGLSKAFPLRLVVEYGSVTFGK